MPSLAYSYLRFSTPEQAKGDSRRRQLSLAEEYARRRGLQLDRSLNFRDLGISAFRGKNAKEGSLRAFLDAVEHGIVPPGSFLLVESLDRLSRDRILEAQGLFLQIVSAGVTIVTLVDQRSYSRESLNANPTDLIVSLVIMMRANEESTTKSSRLRTAAAAARDNSDARFHGGQCPGWLKPNRARTGYEVILERAEVVRRIFREAVAGRGLQLIVRDLNKEAVPLFGRGNQRGKLWQRSLIRHLLYTPLVIGNYTPHRGEVVNGKIRFMPTVTKEGYYPAIVDRNDWEFLRARRRAWSEHYKCRRRKTSAVANVLARLCKCPKCGRPMVMTRTDNPEHQYLVCMSWREARRCSNEYVRYPDVEAVFIQDVEHLIRSCPQPRMHAETRRTLLRGIKSQLKALRTRLARETRAHASHADEGRTCAGWAADTEAEMEALLEQRYRLRLDRSYWQDATLRLKLEALRNAVLAVPRDLARVNERLRLLLNKVVVDWENAELVLHWRHGEQSRTPFYRGRLRGQARNKTPELDASSRRFRRAGAWPPPVDAGRLGPEETECTVGARAAVAVDLVGSFARGSRMVLDCADWSRVKLLHGAEWLLKPAHTGGPGYVMCRRRSASCAEGPKLQVLARLITGARQGEVVTYRDGDPLNLTRANLYVMAKAEHAAGSLLITRQARGPLVMSRSQTCSASS